MYASLYANRLTSDLPAALPVAIVRTAHGSVGEALAAAGRLAHAGHPGLATAVHNVAGSAFFHGFHAANYVAGGVAAAGAVMALALLPAHPRASTDDAPRTPPLGPLAAVPERS